MIKILFTTEGQMYEVIFLVKRLLLYNYLSTLYWLKLMKIITDIRKVGVMDICGGFY